MLSLNKLNKGVVKIYSDYITYNWELPPNILDSITTTGTGFFIDKNGHIITCSHCVENSTNVLIQIPGENLKKYKCNILSINPTLDIALLQIIDYKPKVFFELGNKKSVKYGDNVYAVGFPGNYTNNNYKNDGNLKITNGILSGQQFGLYQTDSAINPGNSGGPLFKNKKVIGINVAKLTGNDSDNIGYSVPIDYFIKNKKLYLNKKRKIIFPIIPTFIFSRINKNMLNILNKKNSKNTGVIISNVFNNSCFKKAGLKKDSILLKINNYKIDNYGNINKIWFGQKISINILFKEFKEHEKIKITFINKEKIITKDVILEPYKFKIRKIYPKYEKLDYLIIGGMVLLNFSTNIIEYFIKKFYMYELEFFGTQEARLKPKIIITQIFPNSNLDILNIYKKMNFIEKINNIKVDTIAKAKKALTKFIKKNNKTYIKFENNNNKTVIFNTKKILKEDTQLSEMYNFELSNIHKKL